MVKPREVIYEQANVKNMLHYVNVWFLPFKWGVNTYRGCEHNCVYCNARYNHEYLRLPRGEFSHKIIVKNNAAEILDKEFSREKWNKKLTVNLATVTDPYQPAESQFKITRKVLEVFLEHHNSLPLTTKSDLVLRDLDILSEIHQTGFLNVVITLPTLNEELRKKIEPKVPSVEKRLEIVQKLHETGITVGVTAIPLLPYISDGEKDLELVKTVPGVGVDFVILDMLNFRGEARDRFMEFLKSYDPDLVPKYEELYQTNYCDKSYAGVKRRYTNRLVKENKVDNYHKMYS
jgi:DNA repair photolyase